MARWEGDHLECNPCGELAGRELVSSRGLPGGVAVALAESALDYTVECQLFQLEPA